MTGYLITEHHLEFLTLKGGCTGSSESTLVKMPSIVGNHMLWLNYCFPYLQREPAVHHLPSSFVIKDYKNTEIP